MSENSQLDDPYLDREQARSYLGVSSGEFDSLMRQYGVGRYHLSQRQDQVFYAKADMDKVKTALAQLAVAKEAPPPEAAADR
jgi:hypothetical protein